MKTDLKPMSKTLDPHTEIELLRTLITAQENELRSLKNRLRRKDIAIDHLRKRIHELKQKHH